MNPCASVGRKSLLGWFYPLNPDNRSHRIGCPGLGVHHGSKSCDTIEGGNHAIDRVVPLASLDRTSNKGLSISFFCFPARHTEPFPLQTFPKTLSPNLITFTATNHTPPQQKQQEVTVIFCSSSRVGEYPKAISKIACLPQNPQHSVSVYSSSISVRSCPNMTARFLAISELNGKCNPCHSPDIQQWRKKPGWQQGGKSFTLTNRGKKEISRTREIQWLLVQAYIRSQSNREPLAGTERPMSLRGCLSFTAQMNPEDQVHKSVV